MAYCSYSDADKKLQYIDITATSNPTSVEVDSFCDDISAIMDSRFGAVGITTPVTDATLLQTVLPICVNGVTAEILRSLEMGSEEAEIRQKLFEAAMKGIEKNPLILSSGSASVDSSPGGMTSVTRPFNRDTKQW